MSKKNIKDILRKLMFALVEQVIYRQRLNPNFLITERTRQKRDNIHNTFSPSPSPIRFQNFYCHV